MDTCSLCSMWDKTGDTPGNRPGVSHSYRKCLRPRMVKEVAEWRNPTDWCNQFTPQGKDGAREPKNNDEKC